MNTYHPKEAATYKRSVKQFEKQGRKGQTQLTIPCELDELMSDDMYKLITTTNDSQFYNMFKNMCILSYRNFVAKVNNNEFQGMFADKAVKKVNFLIMRNDGSLDLVELGRRKGSKLLWCFGNPVNAN